MDYHTEKEVSIMVTKVLHAYRQGAKIKLPFFTTNIKP